jgi:hypothetical protein
MANENLFGPEIEEEDNDGDLDRQPISSLLGIPRCMSRVYYLLNTVSTNKFEFNIFFIKLKLFIFLEIITNHLYVCNVAREYVGLQSTPTCYTI